MQRCRYRSAVYAFVALAAAVFLIFCTASSQPQRNLSRVRGEASQRSLLIVGAAGYVGSGVASILAHRGVRVVGFDRNRRARLLNNVTFAHGRDIPDSVLADVGAVLYLGGFTGRVACETNPWEQVVQENVRDVVDFAKRMRPAQLMMFASTSAIGEGSGGRPGNFTEDDAPQPELFDAYTKSMHEREQGLRALLDGPDAATLPKLVGLRFGTVLGVSPSQRTEFVHVAMVRSALLTGRITVRHPETWRSFLALEDLVDAILTLMSAEDRLERRSLHLYHLVSFSSTVEQAANEVASVVGVPVTFEDHAGADIVGFRLSASKFSHDFDFLFTMTARSVILGLIDAVDQVIVGREITDRAHLDGRSRCVVCGSTDVVATLDLGDQPLANDFRSTPESAAACERHPLHLHRCRRCHHAQLSTFVSRTSLFSNYSYRSGTSETLNKYFAWLAARVTRELDEQRAAAGLPAAVQRTVLEIACNDGTQLTHFKEIGWSTYGVDPAGNLAAHARALGHTVGVGLWGAGPNEEFDVLPENVDAIVAQNVLAHVPDPNSFVAACVEKMHDTTLLYLQTSQCEMFANGQFDTIYHEHVSFFSPSSFRALADRQGLRIVKYEITPIHGGSCFVTLQKKRQRHLSTHAAALSATLAEAIELERQRGAATDAYYVAYRHRVFAARDWVSKILVTAHSQGILIAGYGAAAKGIVLLNYILETRPAFDVSFMETTRRSNKTGFVLGLGSPCVPQRRLVPLSAPKICCWLSFRGTSGTRSAPASSARWPTTRVRASATLSGFYCPSLSSASSRCRFVVRPTTPNMPCRPAGAQLAQSEPLQPTRSVPPLSRLRR